MNKVLTALLLLALVGIGTGCIIEHHGPHGFSGHGYQGHHHHGPSHGHYYGAQWQHH